MTHAGMQTETTAAREITECFIKFKGVMSEILGNLGADSQSGTSLAASLGINRQLAWRLAKTLDEQSVPKAIGLLPGPKGLELVRKSCRSRLGDTSRSEELGRSIELLTKSIGTHAGDSTSLPLLAGAFGTRDLESRTESLRREAFRAQSALFGVHAKRQMRGVMLFPAANGDPSILYRASYAYFDELVRFRPDRPCTLFYAEAPRDESVAVVPAEGMETVMRDTFTVVEQLSSVSSDSVSYDSESLRAWLVLNPGQVGMTASMKLAFSSRTNPLEEERFRTLESEQTQMFAFSYVPSEVFYFDILMHKSLAEHESLSRAIDVNCFDSATRMPKIPANSKSPSFLFELDRGAYLDPTEMRMSTTDRALVDLIQFAAQRWDANASDFLGVRFKCAYALSGHVFAATRQLPTP